MPDVIINGRFLTRQATGVDRFALELVRQLDARVVEGDTSVADLQFKLVVPRGAKIHATWRPHAIPIKRVGPLVGHAWEQLSLRWMASGGLLINLCNTGPIFYSRQIAAIHDAAPITVPQSHGFAFRMWYKMMIPSIAHNACVIVTVSEFSRAEIHARYGVPMDKIVVIPNGVDHFQSVVSEGSNIKANAYLVRHGLLAKRYILCVGSAMPHKNLAAAAAALRLTNDRQLQLAVVGQHTEMAVRTLAAAEEGARIIGLGYVADEDLAVLYKNAYCFLFPSLYEGFGIPPLEAMLCGCPVVSSDRAAMPENLSGAALLVDPTNYQQMAHAISSLADVELRQKYIASGIERAKRFTWGRSTDSLLKAVRYGLTL